MHKQPRIQPKYCFITESDSRSCFMGKSKQTKKKPLKTMTDYTEERTQISTKFRQITKQTARSKVWKVTRKLLLKYSSTTYSFWQSQYGIFLIYSQEFKPWTLARSMEQRANGRASGVSMMLGVPLTFWVAGHPLQYSRRWNLQPNTTCSASANLTRY